MFCPNCGTEVGPDSVFCVSCGARLDQDDSPNSHSASASDYTHADTATATASRDFKNGLLATLQVLGIEAFKDTNRLNAGLADQCDHKDREYLVFMRSCGPEYLGLFEGALSTGNEADLKHAAAMGESYLHDQMAEDKTLARQVSRDTARVIARLLDTSVEWPESNVVATGAKTAGGASGAVASSAVGSGAVRSGGPAASGVASSGGYPANNVVTRGGAATTNAYSSGGYSNAGAYSNAYAPNTAATTDANKRSGIGAPVLIALLLVALVVGGLFMSGIISIGGSGTDNGSNSSSGSISSGSYGGSYEEPDQNVLTSEAFPRWWNGTYNGYTSQNASHITSRSADIEFTGVSSDGSLSGICYVYKNANSINDIHGSYYLSGSIDWDTGYLSVEGTGWADQGNLEGWGGFRGTVDPDTWTVDGYWYDPVGKANDGEWHASGM